MATLASIAERLGVSEATVSNALSGKGRMKPETRELILREAKKEGYTIYHTVKSTIKKVIVVSEESSSNAAAFLRGVSDASQEDGLVWPMYDLNIWKKDLPREAGSDLIRPLINNLLDQLPFRPSGMIYFSQYCRKLPKLFDGLNIPVVAVQLLGTGADVHVNYDNQQGAYDAIVHMAQRGKKRIATISGPIDTYSSSERMIGYQRALIDSQLVYHHKLIWQGDWSVDSGYELTKKLLSNSEPPDAIFAQNDGIALGAINALKEYGLRIPEDVSVIGFDNSGFTNWISPSQSTVQIPWTEMGIEAYHKMCELMSKKKASNVVVPCKLVPRETAEKAVIRAVV